MLLSVCQKLKSCLYPFLGQNQRRSLVATYLLAVDAGSLLLHRGHKEHEAGQQSSAVFDRLLRE